MVFWYVWWYIYANCMIIWHIRFTHTFMTVIGTLSFVNMTLCQMHIIWRAMTSFNRMTSMWITAQFSLFFFMRYNATITLTGLIEFYTSILPMPCSFFLSRSQKIDEKVIIGFSQDFIIHLSVTRSDPRTQITSTNESQGKWQGW